MNDCIFCKIINKKISGEVVFENDLVAVIVPIEQVSKGHLLVIPKKHHENIFDTPEDTLKEMISVTKKMSEESLEKLDATGINFLNASGKDAQQSIFHIHIHMVPRYTNDNLDLWFRNNL